MSDPVKTEQPTPFLTVTEIEGKIAIQTNMKPEMRPFMLWFLEQAKLMVLSGQASEEEKRILPGNGFAAGMMRRIHGR